MTARDGVGLAALNLLFLLAGSGVLWALRGWRTWTEWLRLAGLAYLLGVAVVCVPAAWLLIAGGSIPPLVVTGIAFAWAVVGALVGRRLGRPRPALRDGGPRRPEPLLAVGLIAIGIAALLAVPFFRLARAQGLGAYDAWAFWVPKAKAIYFYGGLDETLFTHLPGASYPILVPTLEAMDFHFIGSADANALHLQFWILLVGFACAIPALLRPRVPLAVVWPFAALLPVMPAIEDRAVAPQADLLLDYFFVTGAVALALFLVERRPWLLVTSGILLAAAMSTKREGQLVCACLLVAALLATVREWRRVWPWLLVTGAGAFACTIPWRLWFSSRHITGETPGASLSTLLHHLGRIPPSFRLVVDLSFDYGTWLLALPLGLAAAAAALVWGRRRIAALFLLTVVFCALGFTWILWSISALPIAPTDATPIPRAVGAIVLLAVAFAPLLLAGVLGRDEPDPRAA